MLSQPGRRALRAEGDFVEEVLRRFSPNISLVSCAGRLAIRKIADLGAVDHDCLEREAHALQQLQGLTGLPQIYDCGPGFLLRQFVPGYSLSDLRQQGWLSASLISHCLEQIEATLSRIHAQGWWHGDLCPSNIVVGCDREVTLVDWGGPDWGTVPYYRPGLHGTEADLAAFRSLESELLGERQRIPLAGAVPGLFGRKAQFQFIQRFWQSASSRESTWIGVQAPSGGGKTALLREFSWGCQHWAWGGGTALSTPSGYPLFRSLLSNAGWDVQPDMMPGDCWTHFSQAFSLRVRSTESAPGALALSWLVEGWTGLLRYQARTHPLCVFLDDVQWADQSDLTLLERLSQVPLPGVMFVLAWRSDEFELPSTIRLHQHLDLKALDAAQVADWAQQERVFLDIQDAASLVQWTQGSPLLISEWLRQPEKPEFSAQVGFMLQMRVCDLPSDVLSILQCAALIGREFDPHALGPEAAVQSALDIAISRQLILPGCRFSHDRVRETLLEQMAPAARQAGHASLAEYYAGRSDSAAHSAFHYFHSGQTQRAAPYALQAARDEAARLGYSAAASFYRMVAEASFEQPLILEMCEVLYLLGRNEEAVGWLQKIPPSGEVCYAMALHRRAQGLNDLSRNLLKPFMARGSELPPRLTLPMLTLLLETCWELREYGTFLKAFFFLLPKEAVSDPFLLANLSLALAFFTRTDRFTRGLRWRLLHISRKRCNALDRVRVANRILTYHFADGRWAFHRRLMRGLDECLIRLGSPWELGMSYLQQGLYQLSLGDFAELLSLARKLSDVASLSNNPGWHCASLFFETVATGARISWSRLEGEWEGLALGGYRLLAQARYLIGSGQPAKALPLLAQVRTPNPIEISLVNAWWATAARSAGDATPRRWMNRRRDFYRQSIQAARRGLACGPWARIFAGQCLRELGLSQMGLGQSRSAQTHLELSLRQTREFGAHYQEALTLQALGDDSGLRRLGAWWDLVPAGAGLPLEEVGVAAERLLREGSSAGIEGLTRWAEPSWIEGLESFRTRQHQLRAQLNAGRDRLSTQQARWQAFLEQGPVRVEPWTAQTSLPVLEVSADESLVIDLPLQAGEFQLGSDLVEREVEYLRSRLPVFHHSDLAASINALSHWFTGPSEVAAHWTIPGLELEIVGELPSTRLGSWARAALVNVIGEWMNNIRKHQGCGHVQIQFSSDSEQLEVRATSQVTGAAAGEGLRRSFGLESMRFRVALAGGALQLEPGFDLRLTLPLQ